ncbi:MAG: DUF1579 domain-containing protein [Candidatus Acidiferrales bacterium]
MRIRSAVLALLCVLLAVAGRAAAQQPEQPNMEEMMQEMVKLATPGEHHKHLEQFIGAWTTRGRFWTAPGAEPLESTGEAEHKPVLGGRFIELTYKGVMMDMPFEGMGFIGYDNYQKKHVDFWIDNFGTLMLTGEGACDASGKTVTMMTTVDDPLSQTRKTLRSVYSFPSANEYRLEMYDTGPDGKEFRTLEIIHIRK